MKAKLEDLMPKIKKLLHIRESEYAIVSRSLWRYLTESQKDAFLIIALTNDSFTRQEIESVAGTLEPITEQFGKLFGVLEESNGLYGMQEEYADSFEKFLGIFPMDMITKKTRKIANKAAEIYESRLKSEENKSGGELCNAMDCCMHYYKFAGKDEKVKEIFNKFNPKLQEFDNNSSPDLDHMEDSESEDFFSAGDYEHRLRIEYREELK